MINRFSTKATDAEPETSEAAAKRNRVMWFVIITPMLTTMLGLLFGRFVRAPWVSPYAIDFIRLLLVFGVVMMAVAVWRVYGTRKRPPA
jgi:undecaprenyl pyrophosphate phosphatase UppP